MRVLVVEEVGFVRHNLEHLLKQHSYDITSSDSCDHGLEILRKDPLIEVVIAPVNMNGLNGVDLFREARQIEKMDDTGGFATFHFILTSTEINTNDSKTKELLKQARDLGISDVLLKPIDSEQLLSVLNRIEHPELAESEAEEVASSSGQSTASPKKPGVKASEIQMLREIKMSLESSSREIENRIKQIDAVCKSIDS